MKKMQIASWPLSRGGFLGGILWWIFAQFERYVPPGSALHPGSGVWNFSD